MRFTSTSRLRNQLIFGLVAGLAGCGGGGGGGGESSADGSSSSSSEGGDYEDSLTHGYVRLEFARADGVAVDPFASTDTVIATLAYGPCLSSFYTSHPSMQQYGVAGAPVFGGLAQGGEGWQDRLCAGNVGEHVDCSIVWITQQFDATQDLTITYRIDSPLEGGALLFGPIPTAHTAQCAAGTTPTVEMTGTATVIGKDVDDNDVWHMDSFAPGEAATGDDAPIVVSVVPVGG